VLTNIDRRLPISNVQTMEQVMGSALAQPRFTMTLLVVFGGLALGLALVGIYGVVSYVVTQRRQEMGIRMALGAEPRAVVWLALRNGLVPTGLGVLVGTVSAAMLTRVMASLMFETTTRDPITYGLVIAIALAATTAATWVPARRAALADPLKSLRSE
jgi:ABC-type antimicrobial peptide transport system permease subunit